MEYFFLSSRAWLCTICIRFSFLCFVFSFMFVCFCSCICVFVCLLQPGSQLLVGLQTQSSRQTFVFCTTLCAPERKNSQKLLFIAKVANIWLTLFIWTILAMFISAIKRLLSSDTITNFDKNPERFFYAARLCLIMKSCHLAVCKVFPIIWNDHINII